MIDPRGMTMQQWFDAVMLELVNGASTSTLLDEREWQEFAAGFVRTPRFAQRGPPDPYQFDNWREWAERAYLMLEG